MFLLSSCSGNFFNKINIKNLVDPDKVAPIVRINSTPITLDGDQTYQLEYDAFDNNGGSGIKSVSIFYSPDGNASNFKLLGSGQAGTGVSTPICIPNKNHTQPTFKILATDKSGNKFEKMIGDVSGQNYSIAISNPVSPAILSSNGLITNRPNTELSPASCPLTQCSANSLKYESFSTDTFLIFNDAAQPALADLGWDTCSNVVANKYAINFGAEGPYNLKLWSKTTALDFDGITPLDLVSTAATSINVIYDITPPTISVTSFTTVAGGVPVDVVFSASDLNGVATNEMQYAADGNTFVTVASNITGSYSWTPPVANTTTSKFKIITTDNAGNINEATSNAMIIDSIAPNAPVATLISPYITSSTTATVTIADCTDREKILINESMIAPSPSSPDWQNCSTLPAGISQVLTGPLAQGIHNLYVWAKDAGGNISPSDTFSEIYDSIAPAINLSAFPTLYKGGDPITLNFSTSDTNGVATFTLEYSPDGVTYSLLSNLATNATSYNWTIPVENSSTARFRLTSSDVATTANTQVLVSPNFTIDTTPPSTATLFVEGTVITGKSLGNYRINDCSDVARVKITRGGAGTPLATDSGWQTCSEAAYTLKTNDFSALLL